MKQAAKRIGALILSVVFCAAVPFSQAFASDLSDLRAEKEELDEKISMAREKADALRDQSEMQMEFLAALRQETEAMEEQVENLNTQIEELEIEIAANQALFDEQYADYCQRLRALYISGSVSNLEVLLTSTDISQLLTRAELISSISKQDQDALNELNTTMEQIEADKAELTAHKETVDQNLAELEEKMAERQEMINQLEQQAYAYTESVSEDIDRLQAVEEELERVSMMEISGGVMGTGQMTLPCPGYSYVSAGYPYYSSGGYHGGVDFAAPYGTAIVAADSGTVSGVYYLDYSFGYHVTINHGGGITTLYGHTSQILVRLGQHVKKGQVIARVGSTGNSTGNHLHFEVRLNGQRQNPWNYL